MAFLMHVRASIIQHSRAGRTRRLLVTAVLVVVVSMPAVVWASRDQQAPTIGRLAADVNSDEPKVRRAALKALAALGPEALGPLSLLVADPERDIRSNAIEAIVAIYVEPPPRERVGSAEEAFGWTRYRVTPWAVPPALVTNLVRALADDWPSERRDAAYALGIVLTPPVDQRVADELTYSLADPAGSVRLAAVRALGRLQVTRAGDQLIGRIADPDLPVRLAAIHAVGEIREARALVALQQQLDYYRGGTAGRMAFEALARIAHRSSANLFAEERFSKREAHRRYAYEGIARLGGIPEADAVALERLLTEEREETVAAAMVFALAAAGRPYMHRLVQALVDDDTANQALEYLVEVGSAQPSALVPYLQHSDPVVRERVAVVTGFVGDASGEAALSQLTTDGTPAVRRAAEVALIRRRAAKQAAPPRSRVGWQGVNERLSARSLAFVLIAQNLLRR
jgi:HEAT repeat protein